MAELETVREMLERLGLCGDDNDATTCEQVAGVMTYVAECEKRAEEVARVEGVRDGVAWCREVLRVFHLPGSPADKVLAEAKAAGRQEALADLARWFREDAAGRADPTSVPLAVVLRRLGVEP